MQNLVILSWNVRSANSALARKNIRTLIKESRTNILLLQETKCGIWSTELIDSIWDSNLSSWLSVNSIGNSGGLLVSWSKQIADFGIVQDSPFWLWCKGKLSSGLVINLVNIYGPHDHAEKIYFGKIFIIF